MFSMKKFVIFIIGFLLCFLIVLISLDLVFTTVYSNAEPRTKFQYLRSLEGKKIDYIFIGSSRVNSGIVPSVIKSKVNRTVLNLGFHYAHLGDIYTVLQLVKKYKIKSDSIFIQVDYMYNENRGVSHNLPYELAPFFWENEIIRDYLIDHVGVDKAIYYLPFVRYCRNETKMGFREIFANLIGKKNSELSDKGYDPLEGIEQQNVGHRTLPSEISVKNIYHEKIKYFGKANNMNIIFYCAPFCKHTNNIDYVKKLKVKIPDLYDFSTVIKEDSLFVNCFHLNDAGARKFTEIFAEKLIIKNDKK